MWDKVKKFFQVFGAICAGILVVILAIFGVQPRKQRPKNGDDSGVDATEQAIRESNNRTRDAIDRQRAAIDEAIKTVGDDTSRQREAEERRIVNEKLINDSRSVRARAQELLDKLGD